MKKKSRGERLLWGDRLRALRSKLGLTQAQMAIRAGVKERTWISWENYQYLPSELTQLGLKSRFPDL